MMSGICRQLTRVSNPPINFTAVFRQPRGMMRSDASPLKTAHSRDKIENFSYRIIEAIVTAMSGSEA